ncbi:MAG: transposase, partial [Nostoc sp. LLA-1]|nr:transposase [Cyanocohniella sp. LLY]
KEKDAAGRYFVSFVVEIQLLPLPQLNNAVGVDLGITTFATLSTGEKVDAPKPLKKRIGRLRRLSKNLSRKTRGSKQSIPLPK